MAPYKLGTCCNVLVGILHVLLHIRVRTFTSCEPFLFFYFRALRTTPVRAAAAALALLFDFDLELLRPCCAALLQARIIRSI